MSNWRPLLEKRILTGGEDLPGFYSFEFVMRENVRRVRILCEIQAPRELVESIEENEWFEQYTDHPSVGEVQKAFLKNTIGTMFQYAKSRSFVLYIFDAEGVYRGRWDPSFQGWKEIGERYALDGFLPGSIGSGAWKVLIPAYTNPTALSIQIETAEEIETFPIHLMFDCVPEDVEPSECKWYLGELHEHTSRSVGVLSPAETARRYHEIGYQFLAISDHDLPPLNSLPESPPLSILSGQEIETFFGHALLLGAREYIRWFEGARPLAIADIIYQTHSEGGLFCALHPFSMVPSGSPSLWNSHRMDWTHVDLLEVWSGLWEERFPEIMKTFDLWDSLLNQERRIYGISGKGAHGEMGAALVDRLPKMLVLSEGVSETFIIPALKQGRCYATLEAAISFWVESNSGVALMGGELRMPVGKPYQLRVQVNGVGAGAFIRIKSNQGIYCESPLSSLRDSDLKFIEYARSEIQWYRFEVYRYSRPVDQLLAFSNPIFIRGTLGA